MPYKGRRSEDVRNLRIFNYQHFHSLSSNLWSSLWMVGQARASAARGSCETGSTATAR
jgi:hypothetical protein